MFKKEKAKEKGLIGIPNCGIMPTATVESLIDMFGNCPKNIQIDRSFLGQTIIHVAREMMAQAAIQNSYDWILFIDSDMVVPKNLIEAITKDKTKEIISAPCYKRCAPYEPCYYKSVKIEGGKVALEQHAEPMGVQPFEVEGMGAACLLIRTSALKKMKPPYFYPLPTTGEDISFCIRAKQAGVKMWVHPLLRVGHMSSTPIYEENYRGWAKV